MFICSRTRVLLLIFTFNIQLGVASDRMNFNLPSIIKFRPGTMMHRVKVFSEDELHTSVMMLMML